MRLVAPAATASSKCPVHHRARVRKALVLSPRSGSCRRAWRYVEDPVSRRLVLPLTWHEQIASDGDRTGAPKVLRRLHRSGKSEYLIATGHEHPDQL
jgi:hypothetical protein